MRVDLLDKEFQRMSHANSDLMASISEANTENFDYENLGEAKCKEITGKVKALEKTMYDTEFFEEIQKIPEDATIKEKVRAYVKAGTKISQEASDYKWTYLTEGSSQIEIRVGLFTKMSGLFYYAGKDIRGINEHPNTVSAVLLEKFLQAPGCFLPKKVVEAEIKGKTGEAKHRISELNAILRKVADRQRLIIPASHYGNHEEINGYGLKID